MYITLIVAEEPRSKIKQFLIAPRFSTIKSGDVVRANGMTFNVLFVDDYHEPDDEMWTALVSAIGIPERVTAVMEAVKWEDDDDV